MRHGLKSESPQADNPAMTAAETLELARSYNVEVRLNAARDGLDLEVEADPPQALVNVLRRAKWDIIATLRRQENEARAKLGLTPLADPLERRRPLLETVEDSRPPDVSDNHWQTALRGLRAFLTAGHGDEAERLGRPRDELYRVPERWSQIHLCGAALLIGDSEVIEVTSTEIGLKITVSGSIQTFRRPPAIDYALIYRSRLKQIAGNYRGDSDEPHFRAVEWAIAEFRRNNPDADLRRASAAVHDALKGEAR